MKTNILQSGLVLTVAIILNDCLKSPDDTAPPPARGYVAVMHLAPTAPSLDVFFNDIKVTSNSLFANSSYDRRKEYSESVEKNRIYALFHKNWFDFFHD